MRVPIWLLTAGLFVLAAGCSKTAPGLLVSVSIDARSRSACAKLIVQSNGVETATAGFKIIAGTPAYVAVARGSFGKTIALEARGFIDAACTVSSGETSGVIAATFPETGIANIEVTLGSGSGPDGGPFSPETNCSDGLDNDLNGKTDCADPACNTLTCNDGLSCKTGETCSNGVCGGGTSLVCMPPNTMCFNAGGTCREDAGCQFAVRLGQACDDSLRCTLNDVCSADGGCGGQPVMCTTPPGQCFASSGTCNPASGACSYSPRTGACNDNNNCTTSDQCDSTGVCAGMAQTCVSTECKIATGACGAAGDCSFTVRPGRIACGNGTGLCDATGACKPFYSYVPSNFSTAALAATDGGTVAAITCPSTVVTANNAGAPVASVTGCATGMSGSLIDLGNGRNAVLVTVDGFTISSGASLTTAGPVPIVFAVLGDATINGSLISASAGRGSCDAGDGQNAQGNGVTKAGGGGGGFGADGGTGGLGNGGLGTAGAGGASNASSLTPLVGGCPGGSGAPNEANGAAGGGAIQLSVAGTLTIAGTVATPGRGGLGGSSTAGGGGGGSGGAILLEANTLNLAASGALTANGGSGGCGGQNNSSGSNGVSGSSGDATPAQPSCGASSGIGGTGGTGTFDAANGGSGRGATAGGGGGGGAVGRIRINATACSLSGVRSPAPASNTSSCAR